MNNKKRYLSYYFPEIKNKKELPINYSFAQFYSLDNGKEDELGRHNNLGESVFFIEVVVYNTIHYEIFSTLSKPISKIVQNDEK